VLAPDTVNEMFEALFLIELAVGKSINDTSDEQIIREQGRSLLDSEESLKDREILLDHVEFSKRKVVLAKPREAYMTYRRMIQYYAVVQLVGKLSSTSFSELKVSLDQN